MKVNANLVKNKNKIWNVIQWDGVEFWLEASFDTKKEADDFAREKGYGRMVVNKKDIIII